MLFRLRVFAEIAVFPLILFVAPLVLAGGYIGTEERVALMIAAWAWLIVAAVITYSATKVRE